MPRASLKIIPANNPIKKRNSVFPARKVSELFFYDFEKYQDWSRYYPKGNLKNVLFVQNAKQMKLKMSRILSKESLDRKKVNRIVVVHSPKKSLSPGGIKSKDCSLGSINNVGEGSLSILSKNIDDFDRVKKHAESDKIITN